MSYPVSLVYIILFVLDARAEELRIVTTDSIFRSRYIKGESHSTPVEFLSERFHVP